MACLVQETRFVALMWTVFLLIPFSTTGFVISRRSPCFVKEQQLQNLQSQLWNKPVPLTNRKFSCLAMTSQETDSDFDLSKVQVMVNGMPGPMAIAAAEACLRRGLKLAPFAMTGPDIPAQSISVVDMDTERSQTVQLIPSNQVDELEAALKKSLKKVGENNLLGIDYTHPSAVNANAEFYVRQNLPFVMGTTGGDRDKLMESLQQAHHFAVVAPNMGKQIVAMQRALENLAQDFPGAFAGYTLKVVESHQKTKADTSGTAKAVVASIASLTGNEGDCAFDVEKDIEMIRGEKESQAFGVPEDALQGHAFHTYTLTSPDKSVQFELKHNVAGRRVYAEGSADAVAFLAKKVHTEDVGRVYSMIDVLEEGALN